MPTHQRKFTVLYDLAGDEIYSRVTIRRTDPRAESRFRTRRLQRTNVTTLLVIVTPLPDSTFSVDRAHRRRGLVAFENAIWQAHRRRIYANQLLPETVVFPPEAKQQVGYAHARRAKQWAPHLGWPRMASHRIEKSKNDIQSFYAQTSWGEPLWAIMDEIQRHMLEPFINGGLFWYDDLWTSAEVFKYCENRVNQFLLQTGCQRDTATVSVGTNGLALLPTGINVVRRAVWTDASGATFPLELGDYHKADSDDPGWELSSGVVPERLILWGRGRDEVQPKPTVAGTLTVDYVPIFELTTLTGLQPLDIGFPKAALKQLVPIPANFSWALKYGIMADMLGKEGEAQDTKRAKYCESRFGEGLELVKMWMGRSD
ncbi:MAG: hypothetical protein V3T22_11225 [Planctomycetota bacterium]